MDDQAIVELYLARDESAISQTALKFGAKLRRLAYGILEDETGAEECENDTYLETWNSVPPHEPRTYLFAFLGRIARHLAIDECRRNARQRRYARYCELTEEMLECVPGDGGADEALEAETLSRAISAYLASCPEEQRNFFVRRYWFFDPVADIARRYGCSQSKVKTALFRMREGLRKHLEKEGYSL